MPSAVFLAWTSFILAWPLAAASLAISVAAVACALTLSSSPIGDFLSSRLFAPIMGRPDRDCNRNRNRRPDSDASRHRRCGPQVLGAAETSVDEVVLGGEVVVVVFLGSVLV